MPILLNNIEIPKSNIRAHITIDQLDRISPTISRLARTLGHRFRLTFEDIEDLVQDGTIAALKAAGAWDPARASWESYAGQRVYYALLDAARALAGHGLVGMPRGTLPTMSELFDIAMPMPSDNPDDEDMSNILDISMQADTDPAQSAEIGQAIDKLKTGLKGLNWDILSRYYGLVDRSMTLRELSAYLGINPQKAYRLLEAAREAARAIL